MCHIKYHCWFKPVLNKEQTCEVKKNQFPTIFLAQGAKMEETNDTRRDHWEIAGRMGTGGAGRGRERGLCTQGYATGPGMESQHNQQFNDGN